MSTSKEQSSAQHPDPSARGSYDDEERLYADWVRRFVRRLKLRLPDEPPHRLEAAVDDWCLHYRRLGPEEAAEMASMWWHPEPPSHRPH